ncbi:MAG: phage virion morphogenesis protein [Magnetococcales bacterium]|nr:phage virion morphogenesis protein [Magnetococcales bacterium]
MPAPVIEVTLQDAALRQVLNRLALAGEDMTPAMGRAAAIMAMAVDENFAAQGRPGWPPLNPDYAAAKSAAGFGEAILTRGGRLRASIAQSPTWGRNFATVGTNMVYGPIHQFGGTITPKSAKSLRFPIGERIAHAQRVTIPARPYLMLTAEDEIALQEAVGEALLQIAQKGP